MIDPEEPETTERPDETLDPAMSPVEFPVMSQREALDLLLEAWGFEVIPKEEPEGFSVRKRIVHQPSGLRLKPEWAGETLDPDPEVRAIQNVVGTMFKFLTGTPD